MKNLECDILVLGGGGSGMVAAARSAECSGKKVIVLEKAKVVGGGMLFASTMRTFRSQWQKERGIPDQTNRFLRDMMDLTMWKLDHKLVRNAILGTGQFFDWYSKLEKPEVLATYEPRPYVFDMATGGQVGPQLDGFHNGSGKMIMETMKRRCQELGVEIYTQHQAVDVTVENGRITQVLAQSPEGPVTVHCKVCVLATGSWIRNEAVVQKVLPAFAKADLLPNAHLNPNYTGDGIPMAEKVGAFVDWDSFCLRLMGPLCSLGEKSKFDALTHSTHAIQVDLNGHRYAAEPLAPRMDPFDSGHVILNLPEGKSYFLFSKNILEQMIAESRSDDAPKEGPFAQPPLPDVEEIISWFEEEQKKGGTKVGYADTVRGLGQQIGVDPAGLEETVQLYNQSYEAGEDQEFFKPYADMLPFAEGPYFAIEGKLATDGAFGGVRVNPEMQAYRAEGGLVPGLFVTGDFASGRHIVQGNVKKQVLNDMSWALSSGFMAGTHAAEALAEI